MAALNHQESSRRARLVRAARELFLERGYERTTMAEVAAKAGFSKRTVYLDFPSKDALFGAVCAEGMGEVRRRLQAVLDLRLPVPQELEGLAAAYLAFFEQERAWFRLLFVLADDETLGRMPDDAFERFREQETATIGGIARAIDRARAEGVLDPAVDSWRLAVTAWGSLTGVLAMAESGRRVELASAGVADLYWDSFRYLVRGAGPAPT